MTNPLADLQKLVGVKKVSTYIADVTKVNGQKLTVRLSSGVTKIVYGVAGVGQTVMISGTQILAVVSKQETRTVYIP